MRAIFVSDPHYGSEAADVEAFTKFLETVKAPLVTGPTRYIVGDVVDSWAGKKCWPSEWHDQIVMDNAILIQGNHDPSDWTAANVSMRYFIHVTKTGARLLVIHGHQFDPQLHWGPLAWPLAMLGARFNEWLMRKFKLSLAAVVAEDKATLEKLYTRLAKYADKMGCDGVVCGHTHVFGHHMVLLRGSRAIDIWDCGCWLKGSFHGYFYEDDDGAMKAKEFMALTYLTHHYHFRTSKNI